MTIYSFVAEETGDQQHLDRSRDVSSARRVDVGLLRLARSRTVGTRVVGPAFGDRAIEAIWECSDRSYGAPHVHRWLLKQGFVVGHNRVARMMNINGWEGETGRRKVRTTIVDRGATAAEDRVKRNFNPTAPDTIWCGDITYLRTGEGWLFLATVIDLYSRRVIGWSVAEHMHTELVADEVERCGRHQRRQSRRRCRVPQRPRIGIHIGRLR